MPAVAHKPTPSLTEQQQWLRGWCRMWGVEDLDGEIKVEISSRMHRSLGRCYPDRKLIRIAQFVVDESVELFREVLCHEAAHVAAHHLHGRSIRPHGSEWQSLVQIAGYTPSVRYKEALISMPPARQRRKTFLERLLNGLQINLANGVRSPAYKRRKS